MFVSWIPWTFCPEDRTCYSIVAVEEAAAGVSVYRDEACVSLHVIACQTAREGWRKGIALFVPSSALFRIASTS